MPKASLTPLPLFIFLTSIIWKKSEVEGGQKKEFNIDEILSTDSPAPVDGTAKKVDEIEGRVGDLKTQLDGVSTANKALKTDLESIKKDISSINDTVKDLLSVYEIVNKEYNPFVDADPKPSNTKFTKSAPSNSSEPDLHVIPYKLDAPVDRSRKPSDIVQMGIANTMKTYNGDTIASSNTEDKFLDRIIKPDDEVDDQLIDGMDDDMQLTTKTAERRLEPAADTNYCLAQYLKLVEYQLENLYNAKVSGQRLKDEDLDRLYRWLGEYKRLLVN